MAESEKIESKTKQFVEGGHVFKLDDRGDELIWNYDPHDGAECVVCGATPCAWCERDYRKQICPVKAETLPGLEF